MQKSKISIKFNFNFLKEFFSLLLIFLVFFQSIGVSSLFGQVLGGPGGVIRRGSGSQMAPTSARDYQYQYETGKENLPYRASQASLNYQVHVLGEVNFPGVYRVGPSVRVTDVLEMAGGIKKGGTRRFVELRRSGGRGSKVLDLYAYRVQGKVGQNPYVNDNDTIFIKLKNKVVEIQGPVRRPNVYELRYEKNLWDLIKLAGGFTVGFSEITPIKIVRYDMSDEKNIIEVPNEKHQMKNFKILDGDVVVIPHKFWTGHQFDYNIRRIPNDNVYLPASENKVFIIGGVKAPGAFPFKEYYNMRKYLSLAGGLTTMAKRKKIKLVRFDGTVVKAKNGDYEGNINPGDTIVVPEKSIPTQFYIGLLPTIASVGLSAAALFTK